jgi:predicted NACHT family NTPase
LSVRYRRAPIVVAARKLGYQQRLKLDGFTELEVLNFRQEDMEQFVNNWFMSSEVSEKGERAADLNSRLERVPRIRALATNPLLLSLIVQSYKAQLDLPGLIQVFGEPLKTMDRSDTLLQKESVGGSQECRPLHFLPYQKDWK